MTIPASNLAQRRRLHRGTAFTLIELLVVIGIIGLLAVLGLPALKSINRSGGIAGAQRQLLDDFSRARHLARVNGTPVYVVFVPPDLDGFIQSGSGGYSSDELAAITNLLTGQYTTYSFVSLRSVGDQPGRGRSKYHETWQTLPQGIFIPPDKYTNNVSIPGQDGNIIIPKFTYTQSIPFPFATSKVFTYNNFGNPAYAGLPYIAFNPQGQLISDPKDAFIPLALGTVIFSRDTQGAPTGQDAEVIEVPPGGSKQNYNLIEVNRMTGQGRYVTRELR